jgi:hypothetical protein
MSSSLDIDRSAIDDWSLLSVCDGDMHMVNGENSDRRDIVITPEGVLNYEWNVRGF